jgi:dolichol-phosphate mannosyltransferase
MPLFFAAMSTGVDFAAGSRFTEGGSYLGRWTRYMVSRGGTVLANLLTGTRMKDMTSGFECFTRDALRHVLNKGIRSRGHFFQTEIRFHLRNWSWVEVPITYRNPSKSVGAGSLKEGLRELRRLRRIARREDPGKCLKVRSTQS